MRNSKAKAIAVTKDNANYELFMFSTLIALAVLVFI